MNQLKKWSSHSLDNLSICLICASEKFSGVFNEIRTHDLCDATQVNLLGSCFRKRSFSGARMRQLLRLPNMCEDHFFNLFISSQLSGFIAQLVRALQPQFNISVSNFKLLLLFLAENKAIEWYLINFSVRKGVSSVWQPDQTKTSTKAKDLHSKVTESTMLAFLDWREN